MVNLNVKIGTLDLKNPVMTASGTFGYGEEFSDFIDLNRLGGYIVKGTTLEPRQGNDYPRMVETPSGMLNAVGLQNKGVEYFISEIYPRIKHYDSELLVNVSAAPSHVVPNAIPPCLTFGQEIFTSIPRISVDSCKRLHTPT